MGKNRKPGSAVQRETGDGRETKVFRFRQTHPCGPEIAKTLQKQKTNSLETRHTVDENIGLNMSSYHRN